MRKYRLSLLFHTLLTASLIFAVMQSTISIEGTSRFEWSLPFMPIGLIIATLAVNFHVFKKLGIPRKHLPVITSSNDEHEQSIINRTSLLVFHNILPVIIIAGILTIISGFTLVTDQKTLFDLVGVTMVLMLALPSYFQTLLMLRSFDGQ